MLLTASMLPLGLQLRQNTRFYSVKPIFGLSESLAAYGKRSHKWKHSGRLTSSETSADLVLYHHITMSTKHTPRR